MVIEQIQRWGTRIWVCQRSSDGFDRWFDRKQITAEAPYRWPRTIGRTRVCSSSSFWSQLPARSSRARYRCRKVTKVGIGSRFQGPFGPAVPQCGASGQPFCCPYLFPAESLLGLCSRSLIPCSRKSRKIGNFCRGSGLEGHGQNLGKSDHSSRVSSFQATTEPIGSVTREEDPGGRMPSERSSPLLVPLSSFPSPPPASLLLLPPFSSCVDRSLPAPLGPRQPD